jgi:hypothetical protein
VFIRGRLLTNSTGNRELNSFVKTYVDAGNTDTLIVLDLYNTSNSTYELDQYVYGNMASVAQVQVPVTPPYINFTEPVYTNVYSLADSFMWAYFNQLGSGAQTNITVVTLDNTTSSHVNYTSYQVTGAWTLLFQNDQCKVISSGSAYLIYQYNFTTAQYN